MKRGVHLASAAALLLCIAPAIAQAQTPPPKRLARVDPRFETLRPDNGFADWRRALLEDPVRWSEGGSAYALVMPGDPLGFSTSESTGGYWLPLSHRLSTLMEASVAPGSLGGAERSILGQVGAQFGAGWGMQAGVRRSELGIAAPEGTARANGLGLTALPAPWSGPPLGAGLGMVTFERSWERYHGAYTVASGRADGGTVATSHRVQVDYFYTARSSFGLSYTTGRTFESSLPMSTMTPLEISNVGVVGEHWFSPSWAINYNALIEDRGIQGLKPELRLGLRMQF